MGFATRQSDSAFPETFLAILGGITVGGGLLYLAYTRESIQEYSKRLTSQFSTNLLIILTVLGAYGLLLTYSVELGILYAISYFLSRVVGLILIFVVSRI